MPPGAPFPVAFFDRPCLEVAPELVGAYLVQQPARSPRLVARIVEVEAYLGDGSDRGSHCHRGQTPRNQAMFGPPGRLYVYRSYGIHICANVVCEGEGRGAAVLLRAFEPVEGAARMHKLRGLTPQALARDVGSGPGKLCQALGITLDDYGSNLLRGRLTLRRPGAKDPALPIARSRRIGLGKGREHPYRFYAKGHPCVSRGRPG